jgi:hypothetical protein
MLRWIAEDLAALLSLALLMAAIAVGAIAITAPRAPASITTVAPPCADARQPCRGRV